MRRFFVFAILVLCFSSCVASGTPPPSAEELAQADYGATPNAEEIKPFIVQDIKRQLKDPESAMFYWYEPRKAWFRDQSGVNRFAWQAPVEVNAKNSYGGYTGRQESFRYYFRGNRLVGTGVLVTYLDLSTWAYVACDVEVTTK